MTEAAGGYETDAMPRSEHQAKLLRQMAEGKQPNQALDWKNIIEGIRAGAV